MAKHARGKVCVLSQYEADSLLVGVDPDCTQHKHISEARAEEFTDLFVKKTDKGYFRDGNPAIWVGPHHITFEKAYSWRAWHGVMQMRPEVACFVPHGPARQSAGGRTSPGKRIYSGNDGTSTHPDRDGRESRIPGAVANVVPDLRPGA